MRSFDKEGLEGTYDEERGDRVEREDISPVLYRFGLKRILCSVSLRNEVRVTKGTAKPGTTGTSAWTRGTEDDTIDELIDENIELAVDSFNVLDPDLDAVFICDVHLNPVSTSAAGTNIMGREHLLTRRGILGHL